MRVLLRLLTLFSVLCLTSCSENIIPLSRLAPDAVILAFGDSLTYGTGVNEDKSYPAVLSERTGREVINAGNPGELSKDGVTRLPEMLDEYQPSLVVLCHGGNDILRRKPSSETEQNIRRMIEQSRLAGAEVIVLAVPEFGLLAKPAEYYSLLPDTLQIPVEMEIITTLQKSSSDKSDSVHFNESGYNKMAQAVINLLRRHGALN